MRYSVGKSLETQKARETGSQKELNAPWFGGRRLGMGKESALNRRTRGITTTKQGGRGQRNAGAENRRGLRAAARFAVFSVSRGAIGGWKKERS